MLEQQILIVTVQKKKCVKFIDRETGRFLKSTVEE